VSSFSPGKIPSRSIVVNEALGNAIVAAVATATGLTLAKFHDNHPGGAIGGSSRGPGSALGPP
jgi:D-arabinose 5-phosphate isomerase GutQ